MVKPIKYGVLAWSVISLNVAFRLYSAFYMIIADCDETFNYWDPLNLLLRGFGKQTWEYSPEYAIRSYTYLLPYYLIAWPLRFIEFATFNYSYYQFYVLRILALCGFTSYAEYKLFAASYEHLSPTIANWFLLFNTIAPGMSHASVALLPSSFAMQCNMLALSNILKSSRSSTHSIYAILWFLTGGIVGWPFALALGVSFGVYTLFSGRDLFKIIGGCTIGLLLILGTIIGIDSFFYRKFVLVPLNIVLYNVFGGEGQGPDIFGVEDASYYILNLLLNFNFIVILGYSGFLLTPLLYKKFVSINFTLPLLIWNIIFFSQPHKEERFLYPIYPLISLNAALVISKIYSLTRKRIPKVLYVLFIAATASISVLRIVNLVENYSAPLKTFELINVQPSLDLLSEKLASETLVNVCIGKEWYHFPNSFFLPDNYRLRFIKSGFDGILPGDFSEEFTSLIRATSVIPPNMNNLNQFEQDKVIPFDECDYFIDNDEESENQVILKGEVVDKQWEMLGCNKIIDPNGNHGIGRILYVPHFLRGVVKYEVEYLEFCALKRIDK